MKRFYRIISVCLLLTLLAGCFIACEKEEGGKASETTGDTKPLEFVDYVSQLKLDKASGAMMLEGVTVKQYVDGDTTHFNVPTSVSENGVLKARYLAINTPESTGQIEEWGKKASNFTKEKLKSATSILIESDTSTWNIDSTGERFLVWVWYKTAEDAEYRNLNLEILQEGLAVASSTSQNRYGTTCMAALDQAKAHKLYVYSGENDPDFYYGDAVELTLKELRANVESYVGKTVAFEGIISKNDGGSVYVEQFDDETNMYHGMPIYYGFNFNGMSVLRVGNKVRIVGSVQYYEAGNTYQVSGLKYDMMDLTNPNNIQKLGTAEVPFTETSAELFHSKDVEVTVIVDGEEQIKKFAYAELALATSVTMKNLEVKDIYVTSNGGDSDGAMTLTCKVGEQTVAVRTTVLKDAEGNLVTPEYFEGKTIDVKGIVDCYDGEYQIQVFSVKDVTLH